MNLSMNELVSWFQVNYPHFTDDMKRSNHNARPDEPNPYHIEDSVWSHSMMVCLMAERNDYTTNITLLTALLHDVGKPFAREEIPFEAKKPVHSESNEIRNQVQEREIPKSGLKVHFRGHEGVSTYLSIEILNKLQNEGKITLQEKIDVLTIISLHGTLFDNIKDGEMHNPNKVFAKFPLNDYGLYLFDNLVAQVKNDSLGRFFTSKDGRKNDAEYLGEKLFTSAQFSNYAIQHREKEQTKEQQITLLVGPPCSGKSTWLEKNLKDETVISRDNMLMEVGGIHFGEGKSYSEYWKLLSENDLQQEIDKKLMEIFNAAVRNKKDIIVDMTNMSRKSRRKWLHGVGKNYNKRAVIFATEFDELFRRNEARFEETGKNIPEEVIENMIKGFMVPMYDEVHEVLWKF